MKKSQQLVVYERLLEKQKHLTETQREDKVKTYKKKLGLGDDSDPKSDREITNKTKESPETSQ
jgi:hypothetical protein